MPKVDWNAPGLYYLLKYREVPDGQFGDPERIIDPAVDVFAIPNPGYYKLWEFQIQAGNDVDLGPESPVVQSYSGQDPPEGKPVNVQTGGATARTVELSWQPVTVTRGSVDGYKVRAASFPFPLSFSLPGARWSFNQLQLDLKGLLRHPVNCLSINLLRSWLWWLSYFLIGKILLSIVWPWCTDIVRVR